MMPASGFEPLQAGDQGRYWSGLNWARAVSFVSFLAVRFPHHISGVVSPCSVMNARIIRASPPGDEGSGDIQVTIPYALYREIRWYLNAIGSPLRPDDLIADMIRGFLDRCGGVMPHTTTPEAPCKR
jgi:hypothetical protein